VDKDGEAGMAEKTGKERLFALDVLRGIACCLVLARHLPTMPSPSHGGPEFLLAYLHRIGWCGVDLFFVLSGFLISSLLFKEFSRHGNLQLSRFWLRRGFKIWPSYLAAYGLMVVSLLGRFLWRQDSESVSETLARIPPNLVFIQNYLDHPIAWPHSWSIAVEEHFYLALPLLLTAISAWRWRQGKSSADEMFRGLGVFLLSVCGLVFLLRILTAAHGGVTWETLYYPTHFRMDALCFGVLLGHVKHSRPDLFARLARAWPIYLFFIPACLLLPLLYPMERSILILTVGFTVVYVGFGALVLLAGAYPDLGSRGPRIVVVPAKGLAWIGVYSYTIYLAHSIVYCLPGIASLRELLAAVLSFSPSLARWGDWLLFWGLAIGGGVLLARVVEQPFLRLRDRLVPSRGRNPDISSQALRRHQNSVRNPLQDRVPDTVLK
jgi:peptidoglycan/LPS O-acetylase OafA/YrhL